MSNLNEIINQLREENAQLKSELSAASNACKMLHADKLELAKRAEAAESDLVRYKPDLTNTATPWPNLNVKLLEASMVESASGEYVRYEDLNKFRIEQQIKVLEEFISAYCESVMSAPVPEVNWEANELMRKALIGALQSATNRRIEQLRQQAMGGD